MPSEGRQGQSIGYLATALALVLGLSVTGGCASDGATGAAASGPEESYPNLGDVPDRPATMTEEQRQRLQEGLVADSQQREYSQDVISFQADPAEPLPAPMETSAGDAAATDLGNVTMPGAIAPPFSGGQETPPSAPPAADPAAPAPPAPATPGPAPPVTATPPGSPVLSVPAAPATPVVPATPSASAAPPVLPVAPVPTAPSAAASAAAAAQASAPRVPVPPEDPMARATTPPFSGTTASVPPVAQPSAAYAPPPSETATPSPVPAATHTPPTTPTAASTAPMRAYTPVPDGGPGDDADVSDLNRAQLDALRPSTPPFSGPAAAAGPAAASNAPTPLSGPSAIPPTPSAYAASPTPSAAPSAPAASGYAAPPAMAPDATAPSAMASAYQPPPPAGVRDVLEARLDDTLPTEPLAPLPPGGDMGDDGPLTTVVVSSRGVASFDELPVNIPVLEREPVPVAVAGGGRGGSLARAAVPGGAVKVATILFEDGSASLREREREIVREVYQRYLSDGRKVRVVGHSSSRTRNMDPVRHRMVNFGISAERANAVALELQRLGVPSEQITVVAAADDMPMYYEVMPSGEAGNRRTEIYLD